MSEVMRRWSLARLLPGEFHEILTAGWRGWERGLMGALHRTASGCGFTLSFLSKDLPPSLFKCSKDQHKEAGVLFPYTEVNRLASVGPEWHLKSS